MHIYQPNVNTDAAKRTRKAKLRWSVYRDEKSAGHKTRGGVGEVGRLIARDKKRRRK